MSYIENLEHDEMVVAGLLADELNPKSKAMLKEALESIRADIKRLWREEEIYKLEREIGYLQAMVEEARYEPDEMAYEELCEKLDLAEMDLQELLAK